MTDFSDFKTGWAEHAEDWDYLGHATARSFSAPADFVPPASMSFRDVMHVEDQGNVSSCVGHGGSSGLECLEYLTNRGQVQFSRMGMYLEAQSQSGIHGDNGATISGCVQAMIKTGCPRESTFPYPGRYVTQVPAAATADAPHFKILGHQECNSAQEVFDWISQGKGPVVFGCDWYKTLMNPTGPITAAMLRGPSVGGHCNLFCGYSGDNGPDGKPMIDDLNSWGTRWCENGWAKWTWGAIDLLCQHERGQSSVIGITNITGFDPGRLINFEAIV